jgi:hypothetical protein
MATGTVRIGISGWRYAPWRGAFYPPQLPFDAERFDAFFAAAPPHRAGGSAGRWSRT